MTATPVDPTKVPSPSPISDGFYNKLRDSAQLGLPALGTLYFTLATIWGWPAREEVVGSIAALNVFVGVVVKILATKYNNSDARFDGVLKVGENPESGVPTAVMQLSKYSDPTSVVNQAEVTFKVQNGLDGS